MNGENPIRFQMTEVQRNRLPGEQMNGDGITGEGIDSQNVELLRRFLLQRKPRVAERHLVPGRRFAKVREQAIGDADDVGVDLVEVEIVARLSVSGECSRA